MKLTDRPEGEGDCGGFKPTEYLIPTMHAFLFLHYLEMIKEHPDVVRELSVIIRNAVLRPGALPVYVVISDETYQHVSTILIGESMAKVVEAAVAEIRGMCDVVL